MRIKVKIAGEEYPLEVTMGAMVRFKKEAGYDVSKLGSDVADVVLFMYCCVKSTCNAEGMEFSFSFEDFADRLTPEALELFTTAMLADSDTKKKRVTQR